MVLLNNLIADFKAVNNDEALSAFLQKYDLTRIEADNSSELARHKGFIEGRDVLIVHTWYTQDGLVSTTSNTNELELVINRIQQTTVKYLD